MQRRDFLKRFVSFSLGILALSIAAVAAIVYPKSQKAKALTYIPVLEEHLLPKRYVKKVEYQYEHKGQTHSGRLYIVFSKDGYIALSPVCTHLGCLVNWDSINKEFICPCHAGRYDMLGFVIEGPPIDPLKRMPIEIRDNMVYIGIYM